jgi:hypothetical protein
MERSFTRWAVTLAALFAATACYDDGTPPRRDADVDECVLAADCSSLGARCGTVPDGCGGVLECGDCPEGETCGGDGTANVCGTAACTPTTCEALGAACGPVGDGCGSALDCGGCPEAQICGGGGTANQCGGVCQPTTCAAAGANCGPLNDGCGGTVDCGGCPDAQTCGGGGEENRCGAPPAEQGGAARWVLDVGGRGDEHVAGLAVREDGVIVALTEIGGTPERPDALGLVWISPDGHSLDDRTYPVRGRLLLGRGPIAVSPLGNVFVAFDAACEDEGCTDLGGPVTSGALVKLSPRGDVVWRVALPNGVASNVAVDSAGSAVVAEGGSDGGMHPVTIHKLRWDKTVEWSIPTDPEALAALAFDREGNVVLGQRLAVTKLDPRGEQIWRSDLQPADGFITTVGATRGGTVVAAGTHGDALTLGEHGIPLPEDARRGVFLAAFGAQDGAPRWLRSSGPGEILRPASRGADAVLAVDPDGWVALLVGRGGCDLRIERWAIDGARSWTRGVSAPGCADAAVFPAGIAVGPDHDVLVGGSFATPVDFGRGAVQGKGGQDGFVLDLEP